MALKLPGRNVDLPLLEQRRQRAGIGGDRCEVGLQLLHAGKPGSILLSEPPFIWAISTSQPVPSVELRLVMPTRPLNSGFQRSAQEVGGVFTVSGL